LSAEEDEVRVCQDAPAFIVHGSCWYYDMGEMLLAL